MNARVNILGVGVHAIDMDMALSEIERAIAGREKGYVCVTNVHVVMEAQDSSEFKRVLNSSFMTVPDGRPLVWVGRMQGSKSIRQVGGPEMMDALCSLSSDKGYTHFFYGGAPGVAEELRDVLVKRYPGLQVVGTYTPPYRPLTPSEESELGDLFARVRPDVTWVGLGAPKQEMFMARYMDLLDTTVMIGVGAAFDMHTGRIQDAPLWAKKCGVAWLFRLAQDPCRLWRRYVRTNPRFIWKVLLQFLDIHSHELAPDAKNAASSRNQ